MTERSQSRARTNSNCAKQRSQALVHEMLCLRGMHSTLAIAVALLSFTAAAAPAAPNDSFLEEALFAGGAHDQAELTRLVARYHQRIDPMVEVVRDQSPAIAAQLLLKHLHVSYGGTTAVLGEYVTGAFSLNEALDTGRYNCLAATTLFVLAARQAGLNVDAERYRSHVRPTVTIGTRAYHVEATSTYGFDADDWYLATVVDAQTGALRVAVQTPVVTGTASVVEAIWAWAGSPRDARWASRIEVVSPQKLRAFDFR